MTAPDPTALATHEQSLAANPAVSAFVSAHAGTGKTTLLIDRLLRLMLRGAPPDRILCLTFTKAAAAEMAIRLHRELGRLATAAPASLDTRLKDLHLTPDEATRARARGLFAEVLDLPGGMRIGTIHAFCQSLLRRFPLEAQLSPHFRVIEEGDARAALDQARETVLPIAAAEILEALAGLISVDGFAALAAGLQRKRDRFHDLAALPAPALRAALRREAGVSAANEAALIAAAVSWPSEANLRDAMRRAELHGSPGVADRARRLLGWLNLPPELRAEHWEQWLAALLRKDGMPCALSQFCNPVLAKRYPDIQDAVAAEQARVGLVLDQHRALRAIDATIALLGLAAPVLAAYDASKARAGQVDYDDLIRHTNAVLQEPGAAWVKYKLDGGLDHLLLDEVQDSSPSQWQVTDALTDDFFSGTGARDDTARTVFAVGDRKQSIYGFQGAAPAEFARHQDRYRAQVRGADRQWHDSVLDVSFRSTKPVLAFVDAVFGLAQAAGGVAEAGTLRHVVKRVGQAGSVTLWPPAPRSDPEPPEPWSIPDRYRNSLSAQDRLVDQLADWIRDQTGGTIMLESAGRKLTPGDMLVLVRRRGSFDRALVRALKNRGVPVAGLDRMVLTEQPAVQDLLSLCEALLLPGDDLSFAEMLTSPLGGLADESLLGLAAERNGSLWETLRARAKEKPDWQAAAQFFATLLARADFCTPFALLSEALGPLGGRARLLARLGPEAAEPMDELLAASLDYARQHPPSLQGFLHWLRLASAEIKREPEAAGDTVRIMTVHGAKGLEAPVVVLPDTCQLPPAEERLHWTTGADGKELFLWAPRQEFRCQLVDRLVAEEAAKRAAEHNRLLYVAATRARDHLLICGWQPRGNLAPSCWHALAEAGLTAVGATTVAHEWGNALLLRCPQDATPDGSKHATASPIANPPAWAGAAPDWRAKPPPPEPPVPQPLSPSRPEGVLLGAVPAARSPLQPSIVGAAERGSLIHGLLQYLPELPPVERRAAACAYVARILPAEAGPITDAVLAILESPELAPLFGPGSRAEQAITALIAGRVVSGRIDRIAILPDQVLIADYKTNRLPPVSAQAAPVLYLRQMAAYRAVLGRLYPDRPVRCVLVWTEGPQAMMIPESLLDRHAPGAQPAPAAGLIDPPTPPISHANAYAPGDLP